MRSYFEALLQFVLMMVFAIIFIVTLTGPMFFFLWITGRIFGPESLWGLLALGAYFLYVPLWLKGFKTVDRWVGRR